MARKKAATSRQNEDKSHKQAEIVPASELAAMVLGCKEQWEDRLILADWLEERLGLTATACLLRLPDLQPLTKEFSNCNQFDYFALGQDVFLWLAAGYFLMDQIGFKSKPCVVVGLYAHPEGRLGNWAKIRGMVALGEKSERDWQRPWEFRGKENPRVEEARKELAAFSKREK